MMSEKMPLDERRRLLRMAVAGVVAGLAGGLSSPRANAQGTGLKGQKVLIAYYSRTGNTREVAGQIHQRIGGDLFEVRTVQAYPAAYRATTDQAKREQQENARPALTAKVADMAGYGVVFVGYPNWWGTLPMGFFTFLEQYDFAGKLIVPFCTHEGSHLGRSVADLRKLCPRATIAEGISLRGGNSGYVSSADGRNEVAAWLKSLGA